MFPHLQSGTLFKKRLKFISQYGLYRKMITVPEEKFLSFNFIL